MKFSIVIPTRNRLEYLKYAIASVLTQDHQDWEVIVSDNHSDQDISGYISSLNEPRIHYSRTERALSVTENWNRALDRSTGDYVILIGDDDCLMQGSLSLLNDLSTKHNQPELIFSNGILFLYPGIISSPDGVVMTIGNWHLWNSETPVMVSPEQMQHLAKESINFRLPFSYNMQVLAIEKSLINRLKFEDKFFHSPYPDYYAMTVLFQMARTILANPYPTVVVGVSPKSFGGYLFTQQLDRGMETLNLDMEINEHPELNKHILPGNVLNTHWLHALASVKKNLAPFANLKINFARYRKLQMVDFLEAINGKSDRTKKLAGFCQRLTLLENLIQGPCLWFIWLMGMILKEKNSEKFIHKMKKNLNMHPGHLNYRSKKEYSSVLDVVNEINSSNCLSHFKTD